MNESYDNQKKLNGGFRKAVNEHLEKTKQWRTKLSKEQSTKLKKLEIIAEKLRRGALDHLGDPKHSAVIVAEINPRSFSIPGISNRSTLTSVSRLIASIASAFSIANS